MGRGYGARSVETRSAVGTRRRLDLGGLTVREETSDLLYAIRAFVRINGYAPTIRELAEELGVGHSTVAKGLRELIEHDKIRRAAGVARGIVVREEL